MTTPVDASARRNRRNWLVAAGIVLGGAAILAIPTQATRVTTYEGRLSRAAHHLFEQCKPAVEVDSGRVVLALCIRTTIWARAALDSIVGERMALAYRDIADIVQPRTDLRVRVFKPVLARAPVYRDGRLSNQSQVDGLIYATRIDAERVGNWTAAHPTTSRVELLAMRARLVRELPSVWTVEIDRLDSLTQVPTRVP